MRLSNNFDFLRLIFSSAVIVSHSFPLTGNREIFEEISGGQFSFGSISVDAFFIISGYLIFSSLKYSKTIQNYLWKRVLRLYPALIVLILVTLIIMPFLYTGNQTNIFSVKQYWTYGPDALSLYKVQYTIDGIFESNPFPKAINGSLWSLSYEFTMYILLLIFFPLKKSKFTFYILLFCFLFSYTLHLFHPQFLAISLKKIYIDSDQLYRLSTYFLAGSLINFINMERINKISVRISLLFIIFLSLYFNFFKFISFLVLPILILLVGSLKTKYISNIGEKFGDISYGIYIYGFLVQQILMNFFKLRVFELTSYSLIITYIIAYFSWHFVEKPMQKYKKIL